MDTNQKNLFSAFPEVGSKEWKQLIQFELKGKDYNQTLVWESLEGIKVRPFYHADEADYLEIPFIQKGFLISQTFFIDNESITNKIALEAVLNGVEVIQFIAKEGFDADILLQNFEKSKVKKVIFSLHYLAPHYIKTLQTALPTIQIEIRIDPIGNLAETGNWFINETQDFDQIKTVLNELKDDNVLFINSGIYQNAGANIVQQVAYALAHANEYMQAFTNQFKGKIRVGFAMGSNFFFEIAKLRAFRYLIQQLIEKHKLKLELELFCQPSLRNKTLYDYNVNILRSATENFSAVLGGAAIINSLAYDSFFKKSNDFSERIARNQLIILREENEMKEIGSIANGSYYIENLTVEIANKALEIFKEIEKNDGFLNQLKKGSIQKKIAEATKKEQLLFEEGKIVLVGTNKFANSNEKMKNISEILPFTAFKTEKTDIIPIKSRRLAEKMEKERLAKE
jgi:methylmalonyl-CoA mutase